MRSGLLSEIKETKHLNAEDVAEMFQLMGQYFSGMDLEQFRTDLYDKKRVIILRDPTLKRVKGFSTITLMELSVHGKQVKAFYSGDTIIDRSCWHPFSFEKQWTPFVFSHVQSDPHALWYWFLVCKGFRTYRYLTTHFKSFWPSPDSTIPDFEGQVLDVLATARFGKGYNPKTRIVSLPGDYCLKSGVSDISSERRKNRYVQFFEEQNPGWPRGEELVCLTRLSLDNIRPSLARFLPPHIRSHA